MRIAFFFFWTIALIGQTNLVTPGVSLALAQRRAAEIRNLRYSLDLHIPDQLQQPIRGQLRTRLDWLGAGGDLILDFQHGPDAVLSVRRNGVDTPYRVEAGHLVLPAVPSGPQDLLIEFRAGEAALNRSADFLYSLFVPDRASTAFPCFDQPDLKARYELSLDLPAGWTALTNAPLLSGEEQPGRHRARFAETAPFSTYLFSFAAGRFSVEEAERAGRKLRFFHRETDAAKVARNREAIFDLHAQALAWLSDYTAQPYPFSKFDFLLVPSFQFGGMEHPASIFYRASSLLLEESATDSQKLARASLIAHETAHMWFGDLVTMRWFDDVWTKEVFANFMAAKIVEPNFPHIDHSLRFFLAHYPAAYEIDRTPGANPIRQPLENLNDASSLYGAIIYQKAPIVMDQLERMLGPDTLRDGLREYLKTYAFRNATWPELISILDRRTPLNLAAWSRVWVEEAGRPTLRFSPARGAWLLRQSDPARPQSTAATAHAPRLWPQKLSVQFGLQTAPLQLDLRSRQLRIPAAAQAPWALNTGDGYAYFALDRPAALALLADAPRIQPDRARAAAWMTLWDALEEDVIRPQEFVAGAFQSLQQEKNELLIGRLSNWLGNAYWRGLSPAERTEWAPRLEDFYWKQVESAPTPSLRVTYFRAYSNIVLTTLGLSRLEDVWAGRTKFPGLNFGEQDFMTMALDLALRAVPATTSILDQQLARIRDTERRERFAFVRSAVDPDPARRAAFFSKLLELQNRSREPWVLEGLAYLHHPLRTEDSLRFLAPGLELLPEIKRSGGIFFPKGWLDATLSGHTSPAAYRIVEDYLQRHPQLPPRLRAKVLQSADSLRRSAARAR